eukprot:gene10111-biopygen8306
MTSTKHCCRCGHNSAPKAQSSPPDWPMMTLGKMTGGEGLTTEQHSKAQSVFDEQYLSLETMLTIADTYQTIPSVTMRDILDDSIKHAGCGVAGAIFQTGYQKAVWGGSDFGSHRDNLAVSLVSKSITKVYSFNFSNTTKGPQSDEYWQSLIDGEEGATMGRGLLAEDVFQRGLQPYYDDKNTWLPKLEQILLDEVYIIGTIVKQLATHVLMPVQMKYFMLSVMGSTKMKEISDKWEKYSSPELMRPVTNFVTTDNHLLFVKAWLESDPYFNSVSAACNKTTEYDRTVLHIIAGRFIDCHHTITCYGEKAADWIDTGDGPKNLGLRTGSSVSGNRNEYCPCFHGGGGCFIAGTMVLQENNRCISIEHLEENDKIVGWHGNTGMVSSEKPGLTAQHEITAFGFNDDVPFFLACHPFWTHDGWRAIDPRVAREENDWLDIGQLEQGDYVRKIKSINNGNIEYEWVKVNMIRTKKYPAGTRFYGIHTREGPRSYHANGYLVCQNYPEITIERVANGLGNISRQEQMKVKERLKKLGPSLEKIMGPAPAKAILSLCEKRATMGPKKTKRFQAQDYTLPQMQMTYESSKQCLGAYPMPQKMNLIKGHFFLDDQYVRITSLADKNSLLWTRPVSNGLWEHGVIKFSPTRLSAKGRISITQNRDDTNPLQTADFVAAVFSNIFKHYRGKEIIETGGERAKEDPEWSYLGELEMGTSTEGGTTTTIAKISLLPMLTQLNDLDHSVQFSEDESGNLVVDVNVKTKFMSVVGYIKLYGTFSWNYHTFSGYCITYDKYDPEFIGKKYEWKGEFDHIGNGEQLLDIARKESLNSCIHDKEQQETKILPAVMANKIKMTKDAELSVEELFLLTPPDPQLMHDLTFSLVQTCMKYDMDEDNLHNILGTVKPSLNANEQEVADAYPDFFGNRFANAYLMNVLSQDSTFEDNFTEEMKNKLLYFWAGNDEGCLSRDPEYNMANNKLAREAYLEQLPRIKDYVESEKGGAGWAEDLYAHITTDEMLNDFALLTQIDQDMTKVQKQSMVLYCLTDQPRPDNPDQNYAADFYCTVLTKRLGLSSDYFDGNESVEEMMTEIIGDLLGQLITEILAGGDEGTKELIAEYKSQLQDYADAYGISMEDFVSAGLAQLVTDATHVISFYIQEFGTQWERFFGAAKKWMDNHPTLGKAWNALSSCLSLAFYGLGIVSTVMAFMGWDNLPTEAKVVVIADTVTMALKAFSTVGPKMLGYFNKACKLGQQTFDWLRNFMTVTSDEAILTGYRTLITEGGSAIEGVELSINEAVAKAVQATEGEVEVMTSKWGKLFKYAGKLAEGASFAIVTLTSAIGLFVEIECLPVIGQVASIVGIVAMVLVWIFGRDPPDPKPPAQVYIEGKGGNYVKSLTAPTEEWLKKYHEQHPDDPEETN